MYTYICIYINIHIYIHIYIYIYIHIYIHIIHIYIHIYNICRYRFYRYRYIGTDIDVHGNHSSPLFGIGFGVSILFGNYSLLYIYILYI